MYSSFVESKKDALRSEKEAYLSRIRDCEVQIDMLERGIVRSHYTDGDDDRYNEYFKECANKYGNLGKNKLDIESLKVSLKATAEVTSLAVHNYSVDVLDKLPEELEENDVKSFSKFDVWKRVEMTCSIEEWIPFLLTYVIREPTEKGVCRSYHCLDYKIERSQPALELSKADLTTDNGPATVIRQLRQYARLCRERMDVFHKLRKHENKSFILDKAGIGGYYLIGELFQLRWFVKVKYGNMRNMYQIEVSEDNDQFVEKAIDLIKKLSIGERANVDLLEKLILLSGQLSENEDAT